MPAHGGSNSGPGPEEPGPGPPSGTVGHRCLTCGNEKEFHRYYVEEARERLTDEGYWEVGEAWEFDDGAYTTYGALCSACEEAGGEGDVVEISEPETEAQTGEDDPKFDGASLPL